MSIHLRCVYSRAYRVLWGWKEDKTRDSSSPWQNPCGCRTSWVLSLPRWCIAMKSLHSLWNRDNTSWPNLNYRVDVLVKRSTLCENAMTYKITWLILLSLSYFPSFSLIFPVSAQPDMSNMSPNKLFHSQRCFPSIFTFSVENFCMISLVRRHILSSIYPSTSIISFYAVPWSIHSTWHLVGTHLLFVE